MVWHAELPNTCFGDRMQPHLGVFVLPNGGITVLSPRPTNAKLVYTVGFNFVCQIKSVNMCVSIWWCQLRYQNSYKLPTPLVKCLVSQPLGASTTWSGQVRPQHPNPGISTPHPPSCWASPAPASNAEVALGPRIHTKLPMGVKTKWSACSVEKHHHLLGGLNHVEPFPSLSCRTTLLSQIFQCLSHHVIAEPCFRLQESGWYSRTNRNGNGDTTMWNGGQLIHVQNHASNPNSKWSNYCS